MRRSANNDADRSLSADSKAEELLSRFLRRHPRFFVYVGLGLGVLILIAVVLAVLSRTSP